MKYIAVHVLALLHLPACFSDSENPVTGKTITIEETEITGSVTLGDATQKLANIHSVKFVSGSGENTLKIEVNENKTYQTMRGFGAALTDSSAYVLHNLKQNNSEAYSTAIRKLFSKTEGIGINIIRITVGACDFSNTEYMYDTTAPDLNDFDIAHDKAYIIPVLKDALSINPDIQILASPWSAPAWMKNNLSLKGGSLSASHRDLYAQYLVKFIQSYATEGIQIHSITIQNEPLHETSDYASMKMTAEEQRDFIKSNLGPAFSTANLNTEIVAYDHNWDNTTFAETVLSDNEANAYIRATAWHSYASDPSAQSIIHNLFPEKDIYFTETTAWSSSPSFPQDLRWRFQNVYIGSVRNWASMALYFNIALNENRGPIVRASSLGIGLLEINSSLNTVTYNGEYFYLGQISKYVARGSKRIESPLNSNIESVAFYDTASKELTVIILNPSWTSQQNFDVVWSGHHFSYTLPEESVVTFQWKKHQ